MEGHPRKVNSKKKDMEAWKNSSVFLVSNMQGGEW